MPRRFIDWEKTGRALELLRGDNLNLRRYVCHELNCENGNCSGDCSTCTYDMDNRISRSDSEVCFMFRKMLSPTGSTA